MLAGSFRVVHDERRLPGSHLINPCTAFQGLNQSWEFLNQPEQNKKKDAALAPKSAPFFTRVPSCSVQGATRCSVFKLCPVIAPSESQTKGCSLGIINPTKYEGETLILGNCRMISDL
jgi:hypothetical protein